MLAANQPIERRAEYMIRAKCNRRIEQEDQEEYSYIWEELNTCTPLGSMQIQTPRRPNMPSRQAVLTIKAKQITLVGRQGKTNEPVTLHAVYAKEANPPKEPPALQKIARMLAQLGGFLARKHDGEPDAKTIRLGYQKLIHYIDALETAARV